MSIVIKTPGRHQEDTRKTLGRSQGGHKEDTRKTPGRQWGGHKEDTRKTPGRHWGGHKGGHSSAGKPLDWCGPGEQSKNQENLEIQENTMKNQENVSLNQEMLETCPATDPSPPFLNFLITIEIFLIFHFVFFNFLIF